MINWLKRLSSRFRKDNGNFFFEIKNITGFDPLSEEHYKLAFRHSSASRENQGARLNNQRLEYLGDAILGAIVADYLYDRYPESGEGYLTSMRSKIVSRRHLNQLGMKMGLNKLVVKKTSRTVNAKSIYGDALEALIGAVYLDRGFADTKAFVLERIINVHVDVDTLENRIASHKGAILEWGQKHKKEITFEITGCYGESHARKFEISMKIDGDLISTGSGSSKKKAEEEASRLAYKKILVHDNG